MSDEPSLFINKNDNRIIIIWSVDLFPYNRKKDYVLHYNPKKKRLLFIKLLLNKTLFTHILMMLVMP
jgi:hypothetical protein